MLENLIDQCLDADPLKRPTADEINSIISKWWKVGEDREFYEQYKKAEAFHQPMTSKSNIVSSHSQAIYTSRLLDYKYHPEPQNSKEINDQFYEEFSGNYL